jgi:hypothetical protein
MIPRSDVAKASMPFLRSLRNVPRRESPLNGSITTAQSDNHRSSRALIGGMLNVAGEGMAHARVMTSHCDDS